jgi:tRNA U34 5-methylaminomethyl-2-thiouridine-forming methyltransferase MnmC
MPTETQPILIKTDDGSNTLFSPVFGENYHSSHGAVQESLHVFVKSGLEHFLDINPDSTNVSILEVGFGTGLNFLLSAAFVLNRNLNLDYTGIEAFPVNNEMISETGYGGYVDITIWESFLTHYGRAQKEKVPVITCCRLNIEVCKLLEFKSPARFDIVYFDAFASARQPEMWTEASLSHAASFLKPGGILVTYAITGNLKRTLKSLGLTIEKLKGAPGKREMLRATLA